MRWTSDKQAHEDMRNASVQGTKGELKIVSAAPGYTFTPADIRSAAGSSFSSSATGDLAAATIEMGIVSPTVSDDTAKQLLDTLNKALSRMSRSPMKTAHGQCRPRKSSILSVRQ